MQDHAVSLGIRFRNVQPFSRLSTTSDGRQSTSDFGFVTYNDDGRYQISSLRIGHRCDHLYDALGAGPELDSANPLAADIDLILPKDSKGVIVTHRDGDKVRNFDRDGRKKLSNKRAKQAKKAKRQKDEVAAARKARRKAAKAQSANTTVS